MSDMTRLNQLLAIEKGVSQRAQRQLTDAYQTAQRVTVFTGLTRIYTPKDDEGDRLPSEATKVQQTVKGLVDSVESVVSAWLNVQYEKDVSNQVAKADVVVDGTTLLRDVPVTYLLWLEKRLVDLHTFVEKWPTLDPADAWTINEVTGLYATPASETVRSRKELRALVKYEATDKHPAQTETYTVDVPVGTWSTTKLSGAASQADKTATLDRVDRLLAAVRRAREAANSIEVTVTVAQGEDPGSVLTGFIFG
jgi:hypothetical protein